MHALSSLVILFFCASASAAAVDRRRSEGPGHTTGGDAGDRLTARGAAVTSRGKLPGDDCAVLNFALALEHLESAFYEESLAKLSEEDFYNARIPNAGRAYGNFVHIAGHERRHVNTLRRMISSGCGTPLPPCEYDFGVGDVHRFLSVAPIIEKIGLSAYDGAVALVSNRDIQTAVSTLATAEARHASFANSAAGKDPFPQEFDTAAAPSGVVSLAAAFVKGCPYDFRSTLGSAPFRRLTLVGPSRVRPGREIQLAYEGSAGSGVHFCSFLFSDRSVTVPLTRGSTCKVPKAARGDIFVAVISRDARLTVKASQDLIVAGPVVIDVDSTDDRCKDYIHGLSPQRSYSSEVESSAHRTQMPVEPYANQAATDEVGIAREFGEPEPQAGQISANHTSSANGSAEPGQRASHVAADGTSHVRDSEEPYASQVASDDVGPRDEIGDPDASGKVAVHDATARTFTESSAGEQLSRDVGIPVQQAMPRIMAPAIHLTASDFLAGPEVIYAAPAASRGAGMGGGLTAAIAKADVPVEYFVAGQEFSGIQPPTGISTAHVFELISPSAPEKSAVAGTALDAADVSDSRGDGRVDRGPGDAAFTRGDDPGEYGDVR